MSNRSEKFKEFMQELQETNATLDYFTDFEKVRDNVNKISIKLHQLNYLIGKKDLQVAIKELWEENSKTFNVLDILIAVRNKEQKIITQDGSIVPLDSYFKSPEAVFSYLKETGLQKVFKNKDIKNLVDYVFGIEVGLDSNARKNRGGENMSKLIEGVFKAAGLFYKKEVNSTLFPEINSLGADVKRFDFVVKTSINTYLIETNFYNTGGSKLNETARAYSDIAPKINAHNSYKFVWITDGKGWEKAKNKLEEAYNIIPDLYNITTFKNFIEKIKKEGVLKF